MIGVRSIVSMSTLSSMTKGLTIRSNVSSSCLYKTSMNSNGSSYRSYSVSNIFGNNNIYNRNQQQNNTSNTKPSSSTSSPSSSYTTRKYTTLSTQQYQNNITNTNEIILPNSTVSHPIISFSSKQNIGEINLLKTVFKVPLRVDLLHRVVRWQRAKSRQGTHYAQNMGDIERTNKKPFAQKGNGRARQGTNHSVHMVGGARAFPPKPRDHSFSLQKKVRKQALCVALSTKLAQGKLIIVDDMQLTTHKTKELNSLLPEAWGRSLLVANDFSDNFNNAAFNLINCDLLKEAGLNVYSILQKDTLVLTKDAVQLIQQRLSQMN